MAVPENHKAINFGGHWTAEKLGILEHYLNAYTTALKSKPFKLIYIDAFAGTGLVEFQDGDISQFFSGVGPARHKC